MHNIKIEVSHLAYERSVGFASCETLGVQHRASLPVPCVKGAVTVQYNIFNIALNIRIKMCRVKSSFPSL